MFFHCFKVHNICQIFSDIMKKIQISINIRNYNGNDELLSKNHIFQKFSISALNILPASRFSRPYEVFIYDFLEINIQCCFCSGLFKLSSTIIDVVVTVTFEIIFSSSLSNSSSVLSEIVILPIRRCKRQVEI